MPKVLSELQKAYDSAPPSTHLNTVTAAAGLGFSPKTLQLWRYHGIGPRYTKVGWIIRYKKSDIEAFMNKRAVQP